MSAAASLVAHGARLRGLRVAEGWSQQALAAHAGVSVPALGRMERGEGTAHPSTLRSVADALGVRAGDLLLTEGRCPTCGGDT